MWDRASTIVHLQGEFDSEHVFARSSYHIQVMFNGFHDIWLNKYCNRFRYRLYGWRAAKMSPDLGDVVQAIRSYQPVQFDFSLIQPALDIIPNLESKMQVCHTERVTKAVFVDAGWKDDHARISIVHVINPDDIIARVYTISVDDSNRAEYLAIVDGLKCGDDSTPVFSDNRMMVNMINNPRVKWIPRRRNRAADRLAAVRRKVG